MAVVKVLIGKRLSLLHLFTSSQLTRSCLITEERVLVGVARRGRKGKGEEERWEV